MLELGKPFNARRQFVALMADDEEALRAALENADPNDVFSGRTLDFWAERHGKEKLLAAARANR